MSDSILENVNFIEELCKQLAPVCTGCGIEYCQCGACNCRLNYECICDDISE